MQNKIEVQAAIAAGKPQEITVGALFEGDEDDCYPIADSWDYADADYHPRSQTDAIDAWLESDAGAAALDNAAGKAIER